MANVVHVLTTTPSTSKIPAATPAPTPVDLDSVYLADGTHTQSTGTAGISYAQSQVQGSSMTVNSGTFVEVTCSAGTYAISLSGQCAIETAFVDYTFAIASLFDNNSGMYLAQWVHQYFPMPPNGHYPGAGMAVNFSDSVVLAFNAAVAVEFVIETVQWDSSTNSFSTLPNSQTNTQSPQATVIALPSQALPENVVGMPYNAQPVFLSP